MIIRFIFEVRETRNTNEDFTKTFISGPGSDNAHLWDADKTEN